MDQSTVSEWINLFTIRSDNEICLNSIFDACFHYARMLSISNILRLLLLLLRWLLINCLIDGLITYLYFTEHVCIEKIKFLWLFLVLLIIKEFHHLISIFMWMFQLLAESPPAIQGIQTINTNNFNSFLLRIFAITIAL